MSPDAIQARFVDEIKLRAYDDRYIDKNEEREILQIAIQHGIRIDAARADLAHVCDRNGYVLESTLMARVRTQAEAAVAAAGHLDRGAFDRILEDARKHVQGRKNDRELKKMAVLVIEDAGLNRVKAGWFTDWYGAQAGTRNGMSRRGSYHALHVARRSPREASVPFPRRRSDDHPAHHRHRRRPEAGRRRPRVRAADLLRQPR